MNRPIEFRAMNEAGNWVYFSIWGLNPPLDQKIFKNLCQWTGLRDKDGKKIFEGDILKKPDSPNHREVKWENCFFYLDEPDGYTDILEITRITHYNYEVIGNIFEHPELLKENHG